jgi:hypothetical protein
LLQQDPAVGLDIVGIHFAWLEKVQGIHNGLGTAACQQEREDERKIPHDVNL